MTKLKNKKILFTAISVSLIIVLIIAPFKAFGDSCGKIRESVLRLHILANSDSEEDQNLKLKIRDAILKETGYIFETQNLDKAISNANENMDEIIEIAKRIITSEGYIYSVSASIENSYFTTRTYENGITLPAGYYNALRIIIGEGKGHNWWCVMFPPMCLPAATKKEDDVKIDDVLTEEEIEIAKNGEKYEFKFALVEMFEEMYKNIKQWLS
ncbi:MAG: stage II sporulation protein R [Oscillospiraceae bacterium]